MTDTKERPIILKDYEVRAVLSGAKTQTRMVLKRAPLGRIAPGKTGDRLWVKETFSETDREDGTPVVAYRAGGCIAVGRESESSPDRLIHAYSWPDTPSVERWQPATRMPRWASRTTLEVTGVRAERLQAITEADARAEGITDGGCLCCGNPEPCGCMTPMPDSRDSFAELWLSIHGAGSWHANPWIWVIEFRMINAS